MTELEHSPAMDGDKKSGLARGVLKGLQVAALAAALVPLGSIPVTPTDQLIGSPRMADAAPGAQRRDAFAPVCDGSEGTGTALAVVPGGKAGFPASPTLLVTSCLDTSEGTKTLLFLTDPAGGEGDGTTVKTITTLFPSTATAASKPTNGWEALALRADKGDLLACGTNGTKTVLWSIDFSPFNTITDGSATFLRNGPTGSSCDGIAWDPSDSSVYQTPLSGFSIFHNKNDGTALSSITVPSVCSSSTVVTGLGIAGTSLFVTCAPPLSTASIRGPHPSFASRRAKAPLAARVDRSRDGGQIRLAALDTGRSPFVLTGGPGPVIPPPIIAQLYKVNGSLLRSFQFNCSGCGGAPLVLYGVPDDPATLASEFNELLWTLDEGGRFWGFEMAGGTIGQKVGVPAPAPGSCPGPSYPSTSGDGLLDCWKNGALWTDQKPGINYAGVYNGDPGTRDVTLCVGPSTTPAEIDANCAKLGRKDLFLEIDFMDFHKPDPAAVAAVVQMFTNAPTGPISLHVQVDDKVVVNNKNHYTNVAFVPCTAAAASGDTTTVDFDVVKKQFFGTSDERTAAGAGGPKPNALNAKALAFRYGLMAHNLLGLGTTSGCAEIGGNDFVVTLGSWASRILAPNTTAHNIGNLDQQSGTLGHEFGHTLGLRHGGGDNINCKPNYVSIMNYSLQFLSPTARALNYSTQELPTLDKTNLNENNGIGPFVGSIVFGPTPALRQPSLATAGGPINWNPTVNGNSTDTGLSLDLAQTTTSTGGCPAGQKGNAPSNLSGNSLIGFNDWANLQFNFRTSVDFADGGHLTSGEQQPDPVPGSTPAITLQTAGVLSSDGIPITVDLKPRDPNNSVNRKSDQDIEVVIFSATGFDATKIVPESLLLQGAGWFVSVKQKKDGDFECSARDARRKDHLKDLVCKFKIPKDTIGENESEVVISGATSDTPPEAVGATVPIKVKP